MRTRLWLLLALACASCAPTSTTPADPKPVVWVVRYYEGGVTTIRNTRTGSCYVGLQRGVYGGTAVAITPAKSLGDCE